MGEFLWLVKISNTFLVLEIPNIFWRGGGGGGGEGGER